MYACSPTWEDYWISRDGLKRVLEVLAPSIIPASPRGRVLLNEGLHFTGGEPFLNYHLLLEAVRLAEEMGYPSVFAETNCYWCVSREIVEERFSELKHAGMEGVLLSINPFLLERIPFERFKTALSMAEKIFGSNTLVYHDVYKRILEAINARDRMKLDEYLEACRRLGFWTIEASFNPSILLPMGRLVYSMSSLYRARPASEFFHVSCLHELTRPWHIHVDCYFNYIPGYCAGISLGDARRLWDWIDGIPLDEYPVLEALTSSLEALYKLAREYGYRKRTGYISPCHLCLDVRLYLALNAKGFSELKPRQFYEVLCRYIESLCQQS